MRQKMWFILGLDFEFAIFAAIVGPDYWDVAFDSSLGYRNKKRC